MSHKQTRAVSCLIHTAQLPRPRSWQSSVRDQCFLSFSVPSSPGFREVTLLPSKEASTHGLRAICRVHLQIRIRDERQGAAGRWGRARPQAGTCFPDILTPGHLDNGTTGAIELPSNCHLIELRANERVLMEFLENETAVQLPR